MRGVYRLFVYCCLYVTALQATSMAAPATVYWESKHLVAAKLQSEDPDPDLQATLSKLRRNADAALRAGPYSVMQKKELPPSGDKHDYLSYSRYWWPNPDTDDGLPYVRRDGQTNVNLRARGDRDRIGQLVIDVEALSLAYYFFGDEKYAQHAALLIRTWFLDPATRMNPNLNFGQAVPGRSEGRGVGIIDTRGFIVLLDCVALLKSSPSFADDDLQRLRQWFDQYLTWLRTSELGHDERDHENNHGSWYAAQVTRIALFVDKEDIAREVVETVQSQRIPGQFERDGSQPFENERTKSLHYCFFNLSALSVAARVGEHLGVDLWHARTGTNQSLEPGLRYLQPFLANQQDWPHQQMEEYRLDPRINQLLRMASVRYDEPEFAAQIGKVKHRHSDRNYASLVCAVAAKPSTPMVRVLADKQPALRTFELPDLSQFRSETIRKLVPETTSGVASVQRTAQFRLLDEAFRRQRGDDLRRRQGTDETQVIQVANGTVTLTQLVQQLNDPSFATVDGNVVTLRLPVLIQPGGTLVVDNAELRLATDRGAFIANAGTLFVLESKVTSWNESDHQPTPFLKAEEFRPFIASYIRSKTYLAASTFEQLGYYAPTAYGLSLSSHPERDRGQPSADWPTGQIVGNVFRGLFYGFYSYEARDIAIVGNTYDDCIRYGIDPHDRSTRLIIANNVAKGTRERHGIIGSRGISDSWVFGNRSFDNNGSGVMLDRQCTGNVVADNLVYANGQGIAIYESSNNLIASNTVVMNRRSGVRVRNSVDILAQENIVAGNGDYGFEVSSRRLDDHANRTRHNDAYQPKVAVAVHHNTVTGNNGGLMKGSGVDMLRLSHVERRLDESKIRKAVPQFDDDLNTSDDDEFGSQLKPHRDQLRQVFDSSNPLVEFRGK